MCRTGRPVAGDDSDLQGVNGRRSPTDGGTGTSKARRAFAAKSNRCRRGGCTLSSSKWPQIIGHSRLGEAVVVGE
jgi:hypothetical protein